MDLIVNFTPTGMIPVKEMTHYVPISINEIIEDVHRAVEIGITMVHLHARDVETEKSSSSTDVYGKIIEGVRSFSRDLIIGVSLSGREITEFELRAAPLNLDGDIKPDMGSLTLSSLNFNRVASINSPEMIQALAQRMKTLGILPELEAFDAGMINYAKYLERKGWLEPPHYFNLLLGNIACAQADLLHVGVMINDLPPQSYWSLAGIGRAQFFMNSVAVVADGGVRIGLEDNIWFDAERTRLASNADLLHRIHMLSDVSGRAVMTPQKMRPLLNLQGGNGKYGRIYSVNDTGEKG